MRCSPCGTLLSDLNTGAFTAALDPKRLISIDHHQTTIHGRTYPGIEMADVLGALAKRLTKRDNAVPFAARSLDDAACNESDPITAATLYPRWSKFVRPDDIVVAETGTVSMGLAFAQLPQGASFHNQGLWGSIGWATPAALGVATAAPDRRVVLFTGEGSHQMTVQELSQFGRLGLKPVIFVLNNGGYTIERLLNKEPTIAYNDVAAWRYAELPRAFGCDDWMTMRVKTCGELDKALQLAEKADSGVYIEVMTDPYEAPPFVLKLRDMVKSLYHAA